MTDTMTSQIIDLSSWDTLYIRENVQNFVLNKTVCFKFALLQNFIQTNCLPSLYYFVIPDTLLELHGIADHCRLCWLRGGNWNMPRLTLNLDARWMWMVSCTLAPINPSRKRYWYPLNRGLAGLQSQSGWSGDDKNLLLQFMYLQVCW